MLFHSPPVYTYSCLKHSQSKDQTIHSFFISGYSMILFIVLQVLLLNLMSLHAALRDHLNYNESNLTSELTVNLNVQGGIDGPITKKFHAPDVDVDVDIRVHHRVVDVSPTRWSIIYNFQIRLVQKCFLKNDHTVAMIGDVPEMVVKRLHLSEITASASVGELRSRSDKMYGKIFQLKSFYRQTFWIRLQRVVQTFVVAAPSQPLLHLALETAKTSVWWNSAAFFIVTSTFENDDCRSAFTYLWTLWQRGILHSVFLCKDNDGSLAMYGYSPYYDGHSETWRKVQVRGGRGGHPWALLKLKQVHDEGICETIAFDKVRMLDGYPIRIGALSIPPTLVINKSREDWFDKHVGEDAMIVHIIWEALNGSIQPFYYNGKNPIGFNGENKPYTGFMADISLGKVDHGLNGMWADLQWGIKIAYPHASTGVHWFTPSKGNMPNWLKFATMYKFPVILGIHSALLIATIFLRYVDRMPWSAAILEIIRAMLSVSMLRLPRKLPSRILWCTLFMMLLVISSGFQGSLISLLTKPTPYQNIDGIDDVLDSGYIIYGYAPFKALFDESKLSNQFHLDDGKVSCFDLVARGRPIACVSEYMYLRSITILSEASHVSKEPLASIYTSYLTKLDWPLFTRFNTLVQRLFNAGITRYWREYYMNQITRKNWAAMRNTLPPNVKVLSVADLAFVFNILIIGLLFSSVVFSIEIILDRVRHRKRR